MSSLNRSESTKHYWRSLDHLEETPEFQEMVAKEFPAGPDGEWSDTSRRRFLQLMGASVALGTASSCRWQKETLMPFADRPEGWVPGKPRHYSTSMEVTGVGQALTVTSYDGRPTKIEGNQAHPSSLGATNSWAQAGTLGLYDPDRSRGVLALEGDKETPSSWKSFSAFSKIEFARLSATQGEGLAIVAPITSSPSFLRARRQFQKTFPKALWVDWEACSYQAEAIGTERVFGKAARGIYDLDKADVILSLEDDLMGTHPNAVRHSRDFATRRKPEDGPMNRLWVVEANHSLTGALADHRFALRSGQIGAFLVALEAELLKKGGIKIPEARQLMKNPPQGGFLAKDKVKALLKALAQDLLQAKSKSLVAVGAHQPAEVIARAHRLNVLLGSVGKTVTYADVSRIPTANLSASTELVARMRQGSVQTLITLGGNPVYDMPADLNFAAAYGKVKNRIHLGHYLDETGVVSTWHLPQAHFLECWNDSLSWNGTWTLAQPTMEPLWSGRSATELLGLVMGGETSGEAWVRQAWSDAGLGGETEWRKTVQAGFVAGSSLETLRGTSAPLPLPKMELNIWQASDSIEVTFASDPSVFDGRFANSGWLQELPDPMTKLTWDNAALMAPSTASALGLTTGSMARFAIDDRSIEMAVYVMPGHAQGCATLPMGYGRTDAGHVAGLVADRVTPTGFNVFLLRGSEALGFSLASVQGTGETYTLVSTQDHHIIDEIGMEGRADRLGDLVRGGDLDEWEQQPDFAQHVVHHPPLKSLWEEHKYEGYRWGMSIDLSTCTGCSACTIACQSENNIPVVGKDEVFRGREMAWIRMDRYFTGSDPDEAEAVHQPVSCQQCEMAPCEQVCPVAATTHTSEGLNDMVYNRCIGTRYCSNNCPYKVRRFNYFNCNLDLEEAGSEVLKLVKNPDVTVRSRGVMEKCTYCVQRIQSARIEAHTHEQKIQDGDITPACAQVCPSNAIQFGDLNDKTSKVRIAHDNDRAYAMLGELNNKPRTAFLARIRNPHPSLAAHDSQGAGEVRHG